ncbi:glycine/D-amino acid oxidase-like deaminating enzyme [Stella humosa]|uniref:Glycine/D-amino acid oxidase-like deaminating enzyme n=1 Tax=Stella humosa TaxID=94 RepID=A0A3N1L0Y8_9PROT|nr:FAD-dependent oxidoreductase [Stella humosa]ROP84268.1 glycine/D-amino acid oxidase-like deaminating enzyme [Stella humosa]BBK33781.1 FAD-dependent oxidoreductase [Stella humosa]
MTDAPALPPSLWAATAPPGPATRPLAGDVTADVAVVGAGYTGLSTALHLAQRGASVVVVEAAAVGWGASGRNNGQVIPTHPRFDPDHFVAMLGPEKGEAYAALVRDSAGYTFDLIRRHGMDCEAEQNGWIQPAHRPGRVALSRRRAEQWGRRGAPVEVLDRQQTAAVTGSDFWHGGWLNRDGGHVNPLAYARGLAHAAVAAGVRLHEASPATGLARDGQRWRVTTPGGAVLAGQVVLATNAYSDDLWPGLRRTVIPVRSYQMATRPLGENVRRSILVGNVALSDTQGDLHFFRFDRAGRLVSGGALVVHAGHDARLRRRIGQRLQKVFPQIGEVAFDHLWHGSVGITADRMPHLHELAPGVVAWIGCQGRGVALASILGREIARWLDGGDGRDMPLPLSPLRPIAAHGFARRIARGMLLLYRWRDGRG